MVSKVDIDQLKYCPLKIIMKQYLGDMQPGGLQLLRRIMTTLLNKEHTHLNLLSSFVCFMFQLQENCFTILCCFLLYTTQISHNYIYFFSFPLQPPSPLPSLNFTFFTIYLSYLLHSEKNIRSRNSETLCSQQISLIHCRPLGCFF